MGRAPRRGWGQARKGERTEGGPRRGALSRAGAHQLPARLKRVAASGPTKDETSGQQGAMEEGVRSTVLMRALTLRSHLLCAHHKPGLSGEHLGEGSRRPKGSGVGLGWGVRQVGRRSEAGPHKCSLTCQPWRIEPNESGGALGTFWSEGPCFRVLTSSSRGPDPLTSPHLLCSALNQAPVDSGPLSLWRTTAVSRQDYCGPLLAGLPVLQQSQVPPWPRRLFTVRTLPVSPAPSAPLSPCWPRGPSHSSWSGLHLSHSFTFCTGKLPPCLVPALLSELSGRVTSSRKSSRALSLGQITLS